MNNKINELWNRIKDNNINNFRDSERKSHAKEAVKRSTPTKGQFFSDFTYNNLTSDLLIAQRNKNFERNNDKPDYGKIYRMLKG